jgi:DNA-nicking Smr family endonuclease
VARAKDLGAKSDDRALWQAAMRDVRPLLRRKHAAAPPAPSSAKPQVAPARKARATGQAANLPRVQPAPALPVAAPDISHGRAAGIDRRSAERLRRGRLPIEGRLDLHGMTQAAAIERLREFIARAEAAGKRCVLVITGKGLASGGILRDQVPRWLNLPPNRARVLAFDYAQPQDGGSGALYVLLKRRRPA